MLEVVQSLDGRIGDERRKPAGIWSDGVEALRRVFGESTIADVARREDAETGGAVYFI